MKRTVIIAALAFVACAIIIACTPKDEAAEAKTAYGAQQGDCVAQFNTRVEIDACRAGVRAAWGMTDAGPDGSAIDHANAALDGAK